MILRAERVDAVRVWLAGQSVDPSLRVASAWVQQWFNCRAAVADALVVAARSGAHGDVVVRSPWSARLDEAADSYLATGDAAALQVAVNVAHAEKYPAGCPSGCEGCAARLEAEYQRRRSFRPADAIE